MKLKNILVPVDFSNCSNNALNYAIELAHIFDAELTLLHCYVIHLPVAEMTVDIQSDMAFQYQKNTEKDFSYLKEKTPALKKVKHKEIIKTSFINDGIVMTAKDIKAELIVMGAKGASNRIDAFFGSNTYTTIRKSKTPVLAIPDGIVFKPLTKILFAADFKHIDDLSQLDIIKTVAEQFKAKVQILHVGHGWSELNMVQTKEAAAIVEYFGHIDHSYHFTKEEIDVEDAIDDHLKEHGNELLILIARKHQFPGSLFKRKVTRRTVMHADLPLLTIPDLR